MLNAQEFLAKVASERNHPKLCGHNGCTEPLGPRVDGERNTIDGDEVCDDCYFDDFGKLIDERPIGAPGVRR